MALTGKTIGELTALDYTTNNLLIPVEESGSTYHIAFSAINYTEIVYSALTFGMDVNSLIPGQHYLITDFKTCYDQPDYNSQGGTITTGNYKQGSVSPILVLATGTNTISQLAYQPQYSGDTIYYDPYFSVTEVTGGEAFGRITYRIDDKGNAFDYDFREVLFKRYNTYSASGDYDGRVSIDGSGNVTGVNTFFTSRNPGDVIGIVNSNSAYGVDFYEVVTATTDTSMVVTGHTINAVNDTLWTPSSTESGMSYKQSNIISNTGFTEYNTFVDYDECFNNTCGNRVGTTIYEDDDFLLSNNVFRDSPYIDNSFGSYFRNNTFNDDCTGNSIKYRFYNNVIDNDFDNNIITEDFYNNMIVVDFRNNYVQESFYNNNLGDDDGTDFENNIINGTFNGNFYTGADVFQYNTINGSFSGNKILDRFQYNNVQTFGNNTIENNFEYNQIGDGFNGNLIKLNFSDNILGSDVYSNNFYGNFQTNTGGPNLYDNNFYNNVTENTLGYLFYNNDIGDVDNIENFSFDRNSFQGGCSNNTFTGNTQFNKVGHEFDSNTIATNFSYNKIGDYFTSNTIASDFGFGGGNYRGNVIGNGFYDNIIGEYFYNNTIPDNFYNNIIGDYFQWNIVDTYVDGVDFTTNYGNISGITYVATGSTATDGTYSDLGGTTNGNGVNSTFNIEVSGGTVTGVTINDSGKLYAVGNTITILGTQIGGTDIIDDVIITIVGIEPDPSVYELYTCNIFKNSNLTNRLSYYDESDVLNIKNINE
jgi:hypothetical protein